MTVNAFRVLWSTLPFKLVKGVLTTADSDGPSGSELEVGVDDVDGADSVKNSDDASAEAAALVDWAGSGVKNSSSSCFSATADDAYHLETNCVRARPEDQPNVPFVEKRDIPILVLPRTLEARGRALICLGMTDRESGSRLRPRRVFDNADLGNMLV